MPCSKLLILGGTAEASALCRHLAGDPDSAPLLSLAGRTKNPVLPPVPCRIGGFGGAAGLAAFLADEHITHLVDATHPFAVQISRNAVAAAAATNTPLLALRRPAWTPTHGDDWTEVPDLAAASATLGPAGRRVFLTIGQQDLAAFARCPQHDFLVRSVDPAVLPGAKIIAARGPFNEADEIALLKAHDIEILVTKNAGGTATRAKLDAARRLGLPVIMVARPAPPACATVADLEGVLAWIGSKDLLF